MFQSWRHWSSLAVVGSRSLPVLKEHINSVVSAFHLFSQTLVFIEKAVQRIAAEQSPRKVPRFGDRNSSNLRHRGYHVNRTNADGSLTRRFVFLMQGFVFIVNSSKYPVPNKLRETSPVRVWRWSNSRSPGQCSWSWWLAESFGGAIMRFSFPGQR